LDIDTKRYIARKNSRRFKSYHTRKITQECTAELQQVSGLNEAIIDNAGMAIVTFDRKGNYLSFNNYAEKLLGFGSSEVIGKNFFHDFFDELTIRELCNEPEFTYRKLTQNVLTHSNIISETVLIRKDKTTISALRSITALRDKKGRINRFVAVATDITNLKKAEKALQESQKEMALRDTYLSAVIDNHPGMFWMKDLEGRFIFSNKANSNFIRLTQTIENFNIIGKKDADFCSIPLAKQYEKEDKAVIDKKKEVLTQDKVQIGTQMHWFEKLKFPVLNPQNKPIGVAGYSIDITDRMRAEAKLRMQSEAFDSFALSILISDCDGVIQWVNHAFEKMSGYLSAEVIGKKTNILKSEGKSIAFYEELWNTLLSGQVWNGEFVNKRKDGTSYYEESTITPVRDNEGSISHFIAIKIDVTHRKEMENALHISEERWQMAIEGSGDGVWDLNLVTRRQFTSPQWKAMLGYAEDEISENQNEWSSRIHPDDLAHCRVDVSDFLSGKSIAYNNEHRLRCKDGSYKWVASRGKIVERKPDGNPLRVIGTLSDITERKQLEITLRQTIEKERELNELKSRFVSTASHEFRTPLASILITSDMLINYWERLVDKQRFEKMNKIKSTILHLTKIVDDVLQVSKIQEGKIQYNPTKHDIVAIAHEVINEFKEDQRNAIVFNTSVFSLMLLVDSRLVRQAITNLISNGLKYTQNGSPVYINLTTEGNNFLFSVKDNGIGISEEDQKHLFTPFFRAANSKMIPGNGLGLNIIRESAHAHGGNISFTSKINEGSTFVLSLPIGQSLPEKQETPPSLPEREEQE
jgi:PAS domain S-box-containing protein